MSKNNIAKITDFDYLARGIAHIDGKTVFISNALINEIVRYEIVAQKKNIIEAKAVEIIEKSPFRRENVCPYYGKCGACHLQHLEYSEQIALKEKIWQRQLEKYAGGSSKNKLTAIFGTEQNYRSRARLAVDYRKEIKLGFCENASNKIVDIDECPILQKNLSLAIKIIRKFIQNNSEIKIAEITLCQGEKSSAIDLSLLNKNNTIELKKLLSLSEKLAETTNIAWNIFVNNQIAIEKEELYFSPTKNLKINFYPDDFVQSNQELNKKMVEEALSLAENKSNSYADLFSGLGNFSLPLASFNKQVFAVEAIKDMVTRAQIAAKKNNLHGIIKNNCFDLFKPNKKLLAELKNYDFWLLDPPRAGSLELVRSLIDNKYQPQFILYISCNPASFARDAKILREKYQLIQSGICDMFANTHHLETINLFELK
ncbi:MAG: 23S rRNA (uracil(1939)-C(5))-methyltransferase RlmD [Cardiobacteriaceae bacterium]|nr:23S rRNA (uracil(1939)-C(5))-methyltransferase RlmD [Cardiobacteriaceae bacterium]